MHTDPEKKKACKHSVSAGFSGGDGGSSFESISKSSISLYNPYFIGVPGLVAVLQLCLCLYKSVVNCRKICRKSDRVLIVVLENCDLPALELA